ncbi:MAG: 3-dehydroquinate synthase [Muribaculaceae bacterium]|nr:3-dehydroquinate synthase [Muribaculaceae bacterium]
MNTKLIFTNNVADTLEKYVAENNFSDIFVHVDVNTAKFVMPILESQSETIRKAHKITSPAGDDNKNIEQLTGLWKQLSDAQATRSALFINLGGGMVSDLGGLAAATFKRGLTVVNVPTTLLSAVDASVGGKTGINFNGFKNHVGLFYCPDVVIISTVFFQTLTNYDMLSGYAEMIKHAMLKGKQCFDKVMAYDVTLPPVNPDALIGLIKESVLIKKDVVDADPHESGLRKVLNYGHTIGHALESLAVNDRKSTLAHGFAVAQGLVVETVLSNMLKGFDSAELHKLATYVKNSYGPYDITCDDYPKLLEYMRQDKKNIDSGNIDFVLLSDFGKPEINVTVSEKDICVALDIYRDLMGI